MCAPAWSQRASLDRNSDLRHFVGSRARDKLSCRVIARRARSGAPDPSSRHLLSQCLHPGGAGRRAPGVASSAPRMGTCGLPPTGLLVRAGLPGTLACRRASIMTAYTSTQAPVNLEEGNHLLILEKGETCVQL